MSKNCGLKKALCPGPVLTGACPFFRGDCRFHEGADAVIGSSGGFITRLARRVTQSRREKVG
jgi:hypothetical protein